MIRYHLSLVGYYLGYYLTHPAVLGAAAFVGLTLAFAPAVLWWTILVVGLLVLALMVASIGAGPRRRWNCGRRWKRRSLFAAAVPACGALTAASARGALSTKYSRYERTMRNLISINDLTREDIETILFRTPFVDAKDTTAVLFFSEPSTRTRVSFEFAAKQLGMNTIVIEPNHSSMVKGETMADTFETLAQYHPHVVIIRHKMGTACQLAESFFPRSTSIISAGTGTTNHPTQALGDLSLILNKINDYEIKDPVIGIVGDVVHSRVASSLIQIANKMDIKVKLFGPPEFLPSHGLNDQYEKYDSLDDLDHTVDFVYVLRPQRERFEADMFDEEWYRTNWCVHPRHINVHQFVMHAGPVNRGLELAPETMELNNCLINDQVREGLYVRQDILQWIFFDRTVKIDP